MLQTRFEHTLDTVDVMVPGKYRFWGYQDGELISSPIIMESEIGCLHIESKLASTTDIPILFVSSMVSPGEYLLQRKTRLPHPSTSWSHSDQCEQAGLKMSIKLFIHTMLLSQIYLLRLGVLWGCIWRKYSLYSRITK